jgi:hypothetical protein
MKRTVWTYGLISGAILALGMVTTMRYEDRISMGAGYAIGYGTMIVALLAVYFGIRSYRDKVLGASEAQLEERRQKMAEFAESYKNPLVNIGMTFLEILPVDVVVVLVSAWVASGRRAEVRPEVA